MPKFHTNEELKEFYHKVIDDLIDLHIENHCTKDHNNLDCTNSAYNVLSQLNRGAVAGTRVIYPEVKDKVVYMAHEVESILMDARFKLDAMKIVENEMKAKAKAQFINENRDK